MVFCMYGSNKNSATFVALPEAGCYDNSSRETSLPSLKNPCSVGQCFTHYRSYVTSLAILLPSTVPVKERTANEALDEEFALRHTLTDNL